MKTIVLAAAILCSPALLAQPLESGTYDVYNQDISVEGVLEGCSLVFTAVVTDTAYLDGAQVLLNGSIALRTLGRKALLFSGKLGTRRLLASGLGEWEQPSHFHFFTKTGTTAGHVKILDAETPGYRLLIGPATQGPVFTLVKEMASEGGFSVGFNRKPGGQDVTASIDVAASIKRDASGVAHRVRNNETAISYAGCVSRLVSDLSRRVEGK